MTNNLRAEGGSGITIPSYVLGTIWTIIVVRWKWIAVHVVFAATSILFLAGNIIYQHMSALRGQKWKSSSLAVLHALDPEYKEQLGGISQHSRLLAQNYGQLARLSRTTDSGWLLRPPAKKDVRLDALGGEAPSSERQTW